jgi:FAD/FMN-containing dehydrogenase
MNIIRQRRVPFAVKGGGHIMNPKFSSTRGIHIAMRRFHKITYHEKSQTVDIGAGLLWDDVYRALEPYNVIVADGKSRCIGVAGVILGGGYGWKTSQYGLSMNNVFEYEVRLK